MIYDGPQVHFTMFLKKRDGRKNINLRDKAKIKHRNMFDVFFDLL